MTSLKFLRFLKGKLETPYVVSYFFEELILPLRTLHLCVKSVLPNRAVGFQYFLAASQPFGVEFVVQFRSARDVPVAFIHLHHFARMTGDAAVGQKVWRVGKDGVEPAIGIFGGDGIEEFEGIAAIKAEEWVVGGEGKAGRGRGRRSEVRGRRADF